MTYSIIQKSQLEGVQRIDAEYYQPEFLELINNLNKIGAVPIKNIAINPKRKFQPKKDEYFNYIEISEVNLLTGEYNKSKIIGSETPDRAQWIVEKDDVIVSTVRPIRNAVSLIKEDNQNLVCSSGFAVLRPERIEPEYLFAYLKSRPIVDLLDRQTTATMYPAITIEDVLNTKIYLGDENFRKQIKDLVVLSQKSSENSKILYRRAEDLLLLTLGLKDYEERNNLFSIVNFSDVKTAERIDAEYFQNKYDILDQKLDKFSRKTLEELCSLISYGTVPTSPYVDKGIPYVKGENLKDCFIDYSKLVYLDVLSIKRLDERHYLKEDDIVISQMGTVGNASLVTEKEAGWTFASFTIRARLSDKAKEILSPLFLTFYIQNIARPYYLLRRIAQASVRQNTDLPTIRSLKVPMLPIKTQQKIAELVRRSHSARQKSKELLEEAKRKVEEIIEKGNEYNE